MTGLPTRRLCAHYGVPPEHSVNAILVRSKGAPETMALCMVPATHRLDVNRVVRKKLGAKKASFASPEDTRAITDASTQTGTPAGRPIGVTPPISMPVMALDYIILGGGNRTSKLKISPEIFRTIAGCEIVEELARPG